MPFFLFDLDKATNLEGGTHGARDFLSETFFTSFEQKRKEAQNAMKQGGAAMEKHEVQQKLKGYLTDATINANPTDWWRKALEYMKTLSPSGVELEIMNLVSFDFSADMQADANHYLARFLELVLECVRTRGEADFCQALLNCCLKVNHDTIVQDPALMEKI